MKNFITLLQKELTESLRNGKWIWLPVALIIIGITQPITTYYMPQILESAGNLPEGAIIEIPTPSGEEVLAGTLSQIGTIGTLLFILASMGAISNERQNGSLTLVMVRPVSALQYITSKWFSQFIIGFVSLFLSYVLTWYYTNLLFNPIKWEAMLSSFAIYSLWIVFILSITILAGTILKATSGIAGSKHHHTRWTFCRLWTFHEIHPVESDKFKISSICYSDARSATRKRATRHTHKPRLITPIRPFSNRELQTI